MDERLRFVARLLEGEKMAALCREFDISRKTGYKIFQRYQDCGLKGLTDRSRRPYRQANKLPFQIETLIVSLKREHPSWGAPKIREKLRRRHDDIQTPAISTVHAVLDRHGLVERVGRRRPKVQGTALSTPYPFARKIRMAERQQCLTAGLRGTYNVGRWDARAGAARGGCASR
jgi:putative transposase